jgi:hypothetical protein
MELVSCASLVARRAVCGERFVTRLCGVQWFPAFLLDTRIPRCCLRNHPGTLGASPGTTTTTTTSSDEDDDNDDSFEEQGASEAV